MGKKRRNSNVKILDWEDKMTDLHRMRKIGNWIGTIDEIPLLKGDE